MVDWKLSITFLLVFENVKVIASSVTLGFFSRLYMVCVRGSKEARKIVFVFIPLNFIYDSLAYHEMVDQKLIFFSLLVHTKVSLFRVV